MKIVLDENIPAADEYFGRLGTVVKHSGRSLNAEDVRDADALIVRSVTRVNRGLLAGSNVRFVGTCTIGIDHLDIEYLNQQGIEWCSAPGCNADSVVEYVLSVLATQKPNWLQSSVGIVGCGNVGGCLYQRLNALGIRCRVYDPLLSPDALSSPDLSADLCGLDEVLACDVVSVHAPLTRRGEHPSFHLLGRRELGQLNSGALLISAGRGAVVDNLALKAILRERDDVSVALDVWEPEPLLDMALLEQVQVATPHIAGYSWDGKVKGTRMVSRQLCQFLGVSGAVTVGNEADASVALPVDGRETQTALNQAILQVYDVRQDDRRMRQALQSLTSDSARAEAFDYLRKHYPERRGFHRYRIKPQLSNIEQTTKTQAENTLTEKKPLRDWLVALGFKR